MSVGASGVGTGDLAQAWGGRVQQRLSALNILFALIVACSIFSELFLAYFPIGPYPIRNYLWAFGVLLFLSDHLSRPNFDQIRFGLVERTALVLLSLGLFASALGGWTEQIATLALRVLVIPFYIYKLVLRAAEADQRLIKRFCLVYVVLVAISASVAVLQFMNVDFAWRMRSWMPTSLDDQGSVLAIALEERHRPMGMAYFPVSLGYQVTWAFPLAWYVWISKSEFRKSTRVIAGLLLVVVALGGLASGTRSALLGLIVQIAFLGAHHSGKSKNFLRYSGALLLAMSISVLGILIFQQDRWALTDASAQGKLWLLYVGILYAIENPLGQGFDWSGFTAFKLSILGSLGAISDQVIGELEAFTPHNQFVNSAVMYGWTGLLMVVSFYWILLRRLYHFATDGIPQQDRYLAISLLGGFIGYIINSLFHNAGLFVGDPLGWYFVALAVAIHSKPRGKQPSAKV
ncbi:MAG: O-antigen ligase family protein [Gammaproteobacteria bacterium]|nr:O-antigen ligase family protein [Gammaproteobacteria bacterium]